MCMYIYIYTRTCICRRSVLLGPIVVCTAAALTHNMSMVSGENEKTNPGTNTRARTYEKRARYS